MLPVRHPRARQGGVAGRGQHLDHPGGEVQPPEDALPLRAAGPLRGSSSTNFFGNMPREQKRRSLGSGFIVSDDG
jgi:S1-C subfamily serine protease